MALRPIWRGHLRLALVTCPVALYTAKHERNAIRFHFINPKTGHRVRTVTLDAESDEEVSRRELVRGYEFQKDHYLLLTDEDLSSVKVESSSTMNVEKFVDAGSIDPIYYDTAYYLAPDGEAGRDVYFVLREAIRRTGEVALSRVVISQRERTIALRPYGDGIAAHTLTEQQDLNDARQLFDGEPVKLDEEMVKLAAELIRRQTSPYQPSDIEDRYERRLREMISAKLKGEGITEEAAEPAQSNVIDLMAALRRSLGPGTEAPVAATQASKKPAPSGKAAPIDKPAPASSRSKAIASVAPAPAGKAPAAKRPRKRA
jgi:DNA end-binding protein Ku